MDPFEEFEFKPLTSGLGFHKKSSELKKAVSESSLIEETRQANIPYGTPDNLLEDKEPKAPKSHKQAYEDLLKVLEKPVGRQQRSDLRFEDDVEVSEPLPRAGTGETQAASTMEISMDLPDMVPPPMTPAEPQGERPSLRQTPVIQPRERKESTGVGTRRGAADSPAQRLQAAPVSIASAILDLVLVVALSLIFLVSLLLVTKVDLASVALNAQYDVTTQMSLLVLFVAVMQMYVVIARSFFGRTLGEWTFDYQMGDDHQHESATYPLKVLWRSVVTTVTGLIVLPLLSFIFRRDVTASLTGLQLYREKGSSL